MKVLVTGASSPRTGSWVIRGEQLGAAIGADLAPRTVGHRRLTDYDVCVVVKRPAAATVHAVRAAGVPLIWDVVDPWPQPVGNTWSEAKAKAWLSVELGMLRPALVIAATQAMESDVQALGWPAVYIPHHSRPGTQRNAVREYVTVVGYEGAVEHLGAWAVAVERECRSRGWQFSVNGAYSTFDIVLGLRETHGYPARAWKSCVKLANAQAAGVPFIGSPESGYGEIRVPGCERFVNDHVALRVALDSLAPFKERKRVADWMVAAASAVTLESVAARYAAAVHGVLR